MKSLPLFVAVSAFVGLGCSAEAVILVGSGGYSNTFDTAPPGTITGDWVTSTSNIAGSETTFSSAADIDTFVSTYNSAGLVTAVGSSATNPPSMNTLARHNTTLLALQMRPNGTVAAPGKAATVLQAKLQNDTGINLDGINVSYDFANPRLGTEEVPGWQAYYSLTADPTQTPWIPIPQFTGATEGTRSAFLDFGGAGWAPGALAYVLWIDDNALAAGDVNDGTGEAGYTMDNFNLVPVPEPSAILLALVGGLTLARRARLRN